MLADYQALRTFVIEAVQSVWQDVDKIETSDAAMMSATLPSACVRLDPDNGMTREDLGTPVSDRWRLRFLIGGRFPLDTVSDRSKSGEEQILERIAGLYSVLTGTNHPAYVGDLPDVAQVSMSVGADQYLECMVAFEVSFETTRGVA